MRAPRIRIRRRERYGFVPGTPPGTLIRILPHLQHDTRKRTDTQSAIGFHDVVRRLPRRFLGHSTPPFSFAASRGWPLLSRWVLDCNGTPSCHGSLPDCSSLSRRVSPPGARFSVGEPFFPRGFCFGHVANHLVHVDMRQDKRTPRHQSRSPCNDTAERSM